jgi:hypothetical protein
MGKLHWPQAKEVKEVIDHKVLDSYTGDIRGQISNVNKMNGNEFEGSI